MAYSDFLLPDVAKRFDLTISDHPNLFGEVAAVEPSALLRDTLAEQLPLAISIQTEKARSELLIMPMLVELRRQVGRTISLFSGVDFTVDTANGLNGICDYLISLSPEQLFIQAPVMAIVEAKNENIKAGMGQCLAALVAAQRFNGNEQHPLSTLYGVVTTGGLWRFLTLHDSTVLIDQREYYIDPPDTVLSILVHLVHQAQAHDSALTR